MDISAIILTFNEEMHIARCIKSVSHICQAVYVVDSFSTDKTCEIATKLGAKVIQNKWPGTQAIQYNWAVKHIEIKSEWILRLDADEYLSDKVINEIRVRTPHLDVNTTGVVFKFKYIFMGRWMKAGPYPAILRMYRNGYGRMENRAMDECFELTSGRSIVFDEPITHDNLNDISWWSNKHIGYSNRQALVELANKYNIIDNSSADGYLADEAKKKRKLKNWYSKMPLFIRAFIFFGYRYFIKRGFLDGKEGLIWHFLQAFWYRFLVDAKIWEIECHLDFDKTKIKQFVLNSYKK